MRIASWRAQFMLSLSPSNTQSVSYDAFRRSKHDWIKSSWISTCKQIITLSTLFLRKVTSNLKITGLDTVLCVPGWLVILVQDWCRSPSTGLWLCWRCHHFLELPPDKKKSKTWWIWCMSTSKEGELVSQKKGTNVWKRGMNFLRCRLMNLVHWSAIWQTHWIDCLSQLAWKHLGIPWASWKM